MPDFDETDMTAAEFRRRRAAGTPVRVVTSRDEYVEALAEAGRPYVLNCTLSTQQFVWSVGAWNERRNEALHI